jgi:hypothetical protein
MGNTLIILLNSLIFFTTVALMQYQDSRKKIQAAANRGNKKTIPLQHHPVKTLTISKDHRREEREVTTF